jgi:hypothetical protein
MTKPTYNIIAISPDGVEQELCDTSYYSDNYGRMISYLLSVYWPQQEKTMASKTPEMRNLERADFRKRVVGSDSFRFEPIAEEIKIKISRPTPVRHHINHPIKYPINYEDEARLEGKVWNDGFAESREEAIAIAQKKRIENNQCNKVFDAYLDTYEVGFCYHDRDIFEKEWAEQIQAGWVEFDEDEDDEGEWCAHATYWGTWEDASGAPDIELAADGPQNDNFMGWLFRRGHFVIIGQSAQSVVKGVSVEKSNEIMKDLWEQFCR